jgi:drug/metabolite transporter (DMT)-like permease
MQKFLEELRLSRWQADAALLLVSLIWGWTFYAVKGVVSVYPVFSFLSIRFALALLILLPFVWGKLRRMTSRQLRAGMLTGLFLLAGYSFQTMGLQHTSISNSGFITGLYIVLVPVFATLVLRQPPKLNVVIGLAVAAVGLVLLSFGPDFSMGLGDTLTLLGAIAYAAHIVSISKFGGEVEVLPYSFVQIATVMIGCVVLAFVWDGGLALEDLSLGVLRAMLLTGVAATALVLVLQTVAQRFTSPTHAAVMYTMEPVFAVMFGCLLAGDQLTPVAWLGGGLILLGIVIAEIGESLLKRRVRGPVLESGR